MTWRIEEVKTLDEGNKGDGVCGEEEDGSGVKGVKTSRRGIN